LGRLISVSGMARALLRSLLSAVCLALLALPGCERSSNVDAGARFYEARGIVRGIAPDASSVDVEHEDIPRFMPSMTMPFSVRKNNDIAGLRAGDAISFRMVVTGSGLFLDRINKIAATDVHLPPHNQTPPPAATSSSRLREGDKLPAFSLTNQDGEGITNETFRGQSLVLTFIFTRCPVPNFCPRLSSNFAELQKAIHNGQISKARLLSVSLDPEFDSPKILKEYGASLHADPTVWTFATGDVASLLEAFSVYRKTEGGTISHGLATALVDADGKIVRIWRGNGWTPEEVIQEIAHGK